MGRHLLRYLYKPAIIIQNDACIPRSGFYYQQVCIIMRYLKDTEYKSQTKFIFSAPVEIKSY